MKKMEIKYKKKLKKKNNKVKTFLNLNPNYL